jgi:hypothetical protein
MCKSKNYQGGFSDEVAQSYRFKDYVEGYAELSRKTGTRYRPGGYIGDPDRTPERDRMLEGYLRRRGLGPNGVADWLASTHGRHMMAGVEETTSESKFRRVCRDATANAFLDVTFWNHPDGGGVATHAELMKRMRAALDAFDAAQEKSRGNAA